MGPLDKEPYPISYFVPYFQNNFYSIFQIIGYDPVTRMPMAWMYMASYIQHPNYCTIYDYGGYLVERIHEGLVRLKKGEVGVKFSWYSLFMHMLVFKGASYFGIDMTLERMEGDLEFPIQCWTTVLDKDDKKIDYVVFENLFASKLRRVMVMNMPRIPKALHDFLRPKDRRPEQGIDHN